MLKKSVGILIIICTLLYSNSCTKDAYYPDVCFQNDILPIFLTKCATSGCHNSKDHAKRIDLTNYDGIMRHVSPHYPAFSSAYTQISSGEMPPEGYSDLTEKEINLVKAWINMGATNSSACSAPCDTTIHTFSGGVQPILDMYCKGCHGDQVAKGGINFSSYAGVNSIKSSRLLGSIKHLTGVLPMPEGASALSECQINTIEKWVNEGSLNN